MGVSAPGPSIRIPSFRDRLGQRVVVPQQSGALLEQLHFCDELCDAPFFEAAVKERVARLANFHHPSYCRVRRFHHGDGQGDRFVLVSAHVAGRRLVEVLDLAERGQVRPTTSAVLALTRQIMAAVALLHDYGPDVFHGALGPERVILAGEGRVVVAEHVLGAAVEEATSAWGAQKLWRDFRLATLPDPGISQFGRRTDIVQIGLTTLATLLGRPLRAAEHPAGVRQLLDEATETTPDGRSVPLGPGLRSWLERVLHTPIGAGYRSLLEAQKAFQQLIQDEGYGSSSVAWDAFVEECETAARRLPAVAAPSRAPELVPDALPATPVPEPATSEPAGFVPAEPDLVITLPVEPEPVLSLPTEPESMITIPSTPALEEAPVADVPSARAEESEAEGGLALSSTADHGEAEEGRPGEAGAWPASQEPEIPSVAAALGDVEVSETGPSARVGSDPFGPWPVADPSESAATLFDTFHPDAGEPESPYGESLNRSAAVPEPPADQPAPAGLESPAIPREAEPQPQDEGPSETLFEAPGTLSSPELAPDVVVITGSPWETGATQAATRTAGASRSTDAAEPMVLTLDAEPPAGTAADEALFPAAIPGIRSQPEPVAVGVAEPGAEPAVAPAVTAGAEQAVPAAPVRKGARASRTSVYRLGLLATLVVIAAVAAALAPRIWSLVYDGPQHFGKVTVQSRPAGAAVSIDGQVRGHTPLVVSLRAGSHRLDVQSGGSSRSATIEVPAKGAITRRMDFPEGQARGGLDITAHPMAGRVTVDGTARGRTPVKVTDLTPGTHSVTIETPLGAQEVDVVVEAGKLSAVAVATASWIKVTVPFEVQVIENGRVLGTSGPAPLMVAPGGHHLDFVSHELALKIPQFVEVPAGQVVQVPLDVPLGMMNLFADQTAEVWVDQRLIGETPLPGVEMPLGRHEVVFRHKKYGEVRYTVMVTLAAPVRLNVTFPARK